MVGWRLIPRLGLLPAGHRSILGVDLEVARVLNLLRSARKTFHLRHEYSALVMTSCGLIARGAQPLREFSRVHFCLGPRPTLHGPAPKIKINP